MPPDVDTWDEGATLRRIARARVDEALAIDVDVGDLAVRAGDAVTIERDKALAIARVRSPPRRVMTRDTPPIALRLTTTDDVRQLAATKKRESRLFAEASALIHALALPVKVLRVVVVKSEHRVVVHIGGEERFDVRTFLSRLGVIAQARVELRQHGLRDAAKVLGGIGPCGLQLCCNTFLEGFPPVTMKMAKNQSLPMTESRTTGMCGRLLCCLVYEEDFYRRQRALLPRLGERVATPRGEGVVRDIDVLASTVRVAIERGETIDVAITDVIRTTTSGASR